MGNRFSRKRDGPASSGETAAAEQRTAEEPAATQPAQQTQEAVKTENLDAVVGEPVSVASTEESVSAAAPAPLNDSEPVPVAKETPAPVQSEPLVSVSEPSPPEPEPAAKPEPLAEAQPAPEPTPEPVSKPELTSAPEAEAEAVPESISESVAAPAEALEQQTEMLTQESLPEPEISSSPLIDLGVPDATPEPIDIPTSPASIPASVPADEPSDIPMTEESQDSAEVPVISTLELEKSEETSEPLEKLTEVEAAGNLEQLVSDVTEENVSELLQNLELKGNDLVADFIPADVQIPDETPIMDMSVSAELM